MEISTSDNYLDGTGRIDCVNLDISQTSGICSGYSVIMRILKRIAKTGVMLFMTVVILVDMLIGTAVVIKDYWTEEW